MKNKLLSLCLIAWLLAAIPLRATAQNFSPDQRGSISVTLVAPDSQEPMAGAELSIYYVASVELNSQGNLIYILDETYEEAGIALEDPELTAKLDAYVSEHQIPTQKMVTDSKGCAGCTDLELGLYFVKQTGTVPGFAPCTPFLVTLPFKTESGFLYHVDASPKMEVERLVDVTVKKSWNTDESTEIPDSVTVQLLRGKTLMDTVILHEGNQWQEICPDLPESDEYSIKEVNIPKGFTATYSQKDYVFTVINTASLAQTGQLVWPIPMLAMAGLLFLLVGFAIVRKSEGSDE